MRISQKPNSISFRRGVNFPRVPVAPARVGARDAGADLTGRQNV
jgi:hypothetical protein